VLSWKEHNVPRRLDGGVKAEKADLALLKTKASQGSFDLAAGERPVTRFFRCSEAPQSA